MISGQSRIRVVRVREAPQLGGRRDQRSAVSRSLARLTQLGITADVLAVMRQSAAFMRRLLATSLCLAAAVSVAVSTAEAGRRESAASCPNHDHLVASDAKPDSTPRIIVADDQAKVYLVREVWRGFKAWAYRGCVYGDNRSFYLGTTSTEPAPQLSTLTGKLALAGTTVAYEESFTEQDGPDEWFVAARDLRTGRWVRKLPTGISLPTPGVKTRGVGEVAAISCSNQMALSRGSRTTTCAR